MTDASINSAQWKKAMYLSIVTLGSILKPEWPDRAQNEVKSPVRIWMPILRVRIEEGGGG